MKENLDSIVKRIKERRIELGLSYQALADRTGMSKSTLQRYETGSIKNVPLSKLKILATGLSTPPEWLMGYDVPKESDEWYVESTAINPFDQALLRSFYAASEERKSMVCDLLHVPTCLKTPDRPASYVTRKNDWEEEPD